MKLFRSLVLLVALPALTASTAVSGQSIDAVFNAIKSGNASTLASYFEANIELTILDDEGAYSKAQAEQVVRNFFASHTPSSFAKKHESSSGGNSHFAVGTLGTSNGSFRVDIFYKIVGNQLRIQRLKFTES
jgi:hypothetical protein